MSHRAEHEIQHGEHLAGKDTELVWGWGSPAGRKRASRRAHLIGEGAKLNSSAKVLEIGCGTGMFTEMFAQTKARIIAVDISADLLKTATARNLPENQVSFMEKQFEECDVEGPFDAVIGSSILHHLDMTSAVPRIFKLLKPGGVMSFAEPNMLNPQIFLERRYRKLFPNVSPDETAFVRWSLKTMLRNAGFTDIKITPFDWLHPSVPKKLISIVSMMGSVLEALPLLREFSGSLYIQATRPHG